MKIVALDKSYWPRGGYGHWCPACNSGHEIDTEQKNGSGAIWMFDGNHARPSFKPSINLQINPKGHKHYQPDIESTVCHYHVTQGTIIFCADCTHAMKGQTVSMPDIPRTAYVTSQFLARGAIGGR